MNSRRDGIDGIYTPSVNKRVTLPARAPRTPSRRTPSAAAAGEVERASERARARERPAARDTRRWIACARDRGWCVRASSRARREARPRCYRREESLAPRPCLIEHRPRRDLARAPLLAKGSEARARRVRRRYARVGRRSEPRAYRGNLSAAASPRARAEGPHAGPKVFQRSSAPALALSGARDAPFVRIHGRDARRRRRRA